MVVGPGDQILVDGQIVGEGEILIAGSSPGQGERQAVRRAGDEVTADDYCISGRAIYRARNAKVSRRVTALSSGAQVLSHELTPLQTLIKNVLRTLFVLVILLSGLLVLESYLLQADLASREYRDAFSIVSSLTPEAFAAAAGVRERILRRKVENHRLRVMDDRVPDFLVRNPDLQVTKVDANTYRLVGYSNLDPLLVPVEVYALLDFFDGELRTKRVKRLVAEAGLGSPTDALLLALYRSRVLLTEG